MVGVIGLEGVGGVKLWYLISTERMRLVRKVAYRVEVASLIEIMNGLLEVIGGEGVCRLERVGIGRRSVRLLRVLVGVVGWMFEQVV